MEWSPTAQARDDPACFRSGFLHLHLPRSEIFKALMSAFGGEPLVGALKSCRYSPLSDLGEAADSGLLRLALARGWRT